MTAVARPPSGANALPQMQGPEFFRAVREEGLAAVVGRVGGIVQVLGALPAEEAGGALATLRSLPEEEWILSANVRAAEADHRFWRYEGSGADAAKQRILDLAPDMHPIFSAARYDAGGRITLHNDARRWKRK